MHAFYVFFFLEKGIEWIILTLMLPYLEPLRIPDIKQNGGKYKIFTLTRHTATLSDLPKSILKLNEEEPRIWAGERTAVIFEPFWQWQASMLIPSPKRFAQTWPTSGDPGPMMHIAFPHLQLEPIG